MVEKIYENNTLSLRFVASLGNFQYQELIINNFCESTNLQGPQICFEIPIMSKFTMRIEKNSK